MSRTLLLVLTLLAFAGGVAFLVLTDQGGSGTGRAGVLRPPDSDADRDHADLPLLRGRAPGHAATDPRAAGRRGPAAAPTSAKAVPSGEVTVHLLDDAGLPLAGRWVSAFAGDTLLGQARTDAQGVAHFPSLPLDGSAWLVAGQLSTRPDVLVQVTGADVTMKGQHLLPLQVVLVDGATGGELGYASWRPRQKDAVQSWPSGHTIQVDVHPGQALTEPFVVEAPAGLVDAETPWTTWISRFASGLRAVHPLRAEARVNVVPVDAEGKDVRDVQIYRFQVGAYVDDSPQQDAWMLGAIPLRGVPSFPGETLDVLAATTGSLVGGGTATLPPTPNEPVDVKVVLGKGARTPIDTPFQAPVGSYGGSLQSGDVIRSAGAPSAVVGRLVVDVLLSDGRPGVGVHVSVPKPGDYRTDAQGHVVVEDVLAGDRRVVLAEPGLLPVARDFTLVPGGEAHVLLQEPEGGAVALVVKDEGGRPLPFAAIQVTQPSGLPWIDLGPDGVERLDPFVDADGQRTLGRVEPGVVKIRGRWGGLAGEVDATVRERDSVDVTLILHPPRKK